MVPLLQFKAVVFVKYTLQPRMTVKPMDVFPAQYAQALFSAQCLVVTLLLGFG
jgi:hypothetical protein